MFPLQGAWSVNDYLALDTGLLVEYTSGFVRVLPMPNVLHQLIVQYLFRVLEDFVRARGLGHVFVAPIPVRLAEDKYREPDVIFVRPERIADLTGYPAGADLVIEVVSDGPDNRQRDLVDKRLEYAAANIQEYWIVDPQERTVSVLSLDGNAYQEVGVFHETDRASSALLAGFSVEVRELFARGVTPPRSRA
jgi:Uma2 family endonuclease